jgi:hypothetical protein
MLKHGDAVGVFEAGTVEQVSHGFGRTGRESVGLHVRFDQGVRPCGAQPSHQIVPLQGAADALPRDHGKIALGAGEGEARGVMQRIVGHEHVKIALHDLAHREVREGVARARGVGLRCGAEPDEERDQHQHRIGGEPDHAKDHG